MAWFQCYHLFSVCCVWDSFFLVAVNAHNFIYTMVLSTFDVIIVVLPRLCQGFAVTAWHAYASSGCSTVGMGA